MCSCSRRSPSWPVAGTAERGTGWASQISVRRRRRPYIEFDCGQKQDAENAKEEQRGRGEKRNRHQASWRRSALAATHLPFGEESPTCAGRALRTASWLALLGVLSALPLRSLRSASESKLQDRLDPGILTPYEAARERWTPTGMAPRRAYSPCCRMSGFFQAAMARAVAS